jgi:hypothetical protein
MGASSEPNPWDSDRLRLPAEMMGETERRRQPPRHRLRGPLIKGPISDAWIASACRLPGAGLHVVMAYRFDGNRFRLKRRGQVISEREGAGRSPVSGLRRNANSPGAGFRPRRPSVRPAPGLPGDPPSGRRNEGRTNRPDVGGGSWSWVGSQAVHRITRRMDDPSAGFRSRCGVIASLTHCRLRPQMVKRAYLSEIGPPESIQPANDTLSAVVPTARHAVKCAE